MFLVNKQPARYSHHMLEILEKSTPPKDDIITLLSRTGEEQQQLYILSASQCVEFLKDVIAEAKLVWTMPGVEIV